MDSRIPEDRYLIVAEVLAQTLPRLMTNRCSRRRITLIIITKSRDPVTSPTILVGTCMSRLPLLSPTRRTIRQPPMVIIILRRRKTTTITTALSLSQI